MGAVYRAWDQQTGAMVALKILHGQGGDNVERFARETRLLSELNHPGIVRYIAHGTTENGEPYLAMEWLDGEGLDERLTRGVLAVEEAIVLGQHMAEILDLAHQQGVVHRDLKPANIFLIDGSVQRIKLVDFGIAHVLDPAQELTATGSMLGTPGFMAPEQLRTARHVDGRADIYALGCVLYTALTGKQVFAGDTPLAVLMQVLMEPAPRLSAVRSDVPPALDGLVAQMLAKEPDQRPAQAATILGALAAIAAGDSVESLAEQFGPSGGHSVLLVRAAPVAGQQGTVQERFNPESVAHLQSLVGANGAELEMLADGTALVGLPATTSGPLEQQTQQLARIALAIWSQHPELRLVLIAEAGAPGQRAGALARGVNLIERTANPGIRLNDVAARLLGAQFEVSTDHEGTSLRGERGMVLGQGPAPSTEPNTATPVVRELGPGQAVATGDTAAATAAPSKALWIGLGALALAGAVGGGIAVYSGFFAKDSGDSPAPASSAFVCPYERCDPYKIKNRSEVTEALPGVNKFATSVDPSAKLVMFHTVPSVDARLKPKDGAAAFLFRYGPVTKGKVNTFTVIFGHDHLMLNRGPPIKVLAPVPRPKCKIRAVWRAALKAGLPKGATSTIIYQNNLLKENTAEWLLTNTSSSRTFRIDPDKCTVQARSAGGKWEAPPKSS